MVWLLLAAMAVLALAPLGVALVRGGRVTGRREPAAALHRAQLGELDRDLAEGRIGVAEHATATLEVQRRLLAEAAAAEMVPVRARRWPLAVALVAVPVAAGLLYWPQSHPLMPSSSPAEQARLAHEQMDALIGDLRARLATVDPSTAQAREGYVLLGNVEDRRGNLAGAVAAWQRALASRFDPTLAAEIAEAETRLAGHVTDAAAALFTRALAAAPADAPWRRIVEQRLKEHQAAP